MLVSGYSLQMALVDCNHAAEAVNAVAELSDDIGEVLPYLNAVLKGARYSPRVPALAFAHEGHRIVLRSRQAAIAKLQGEEEARQVMDWVVETINRVWEDRANIRPNHEPAREPGLLEVYRLLPGGNCRECGEATCLAFAAKLLRGEARPDECAPLAEARYSDKRGALSGLLGVPDAT
ncbi:MAG: (Fe-S)-binding protein [Chloroflexota bacterium]